MKQGDYYITHSLMDKQDLESIIKAPNIKVNVHPAYHFFKMKDMSRQEAREELKLKDDEKVLLFFGLIRDYKGLQHLLNAMPGIKQKVSNVKLLIAGDVCGSRDKYDEIIENNNISDVIDVYGRHLQTEEVEKFFAACDLVVLPYESATQSGVIQVAYSFDKPVLATNVGGLPNMREKYSWDRMTETIESFME